MAALARRLLAAVAGVACVGAFGSLAHAGLAADIGHDALATALGDALPDGSGLVVMQVEAPVTVDGQAAWLPDPAVAEIAAKNIIDVSGSPAGAYSGHATGVARRLFGSVTSIAPGIDTVYAVEADGWLGSDGLRVGSGRRPLATPGRIGNHSWIGTAEVLDGEALRRLDWLIESEEFVQVVGLSNGATNPPLLSGAYNVVAVGVTEGEHGDGAAAVDAVYTGGRSRPHLVVPLTTTSSATPTVAAAIALLVETAQAQPALSADPAVQSVNTDSGGLVYNASRSEVLKAAIMAGAARQTANSGGADIVDYRGELANQAPNGLDRRYGAGQLDVFTSYRIIAAGEQNSAEDEPGTGGAVGAAGFDYDPAFGGSRGSNVRASYRLPAIGPARLLTAALVWNVPIDGGSRVAFDGTATLLDIDLRLLDVTDGTPGVEVARSSAGVGYNSEHLWLELEAGRSYQLQVDPGAGQGNFEHDFALAWVLREPPAPDSDGDGVADPEDNCLLVANPDQADGDQDGYGNPCDADLNNDGVVNFADLALMKAVFGTGDTQADLDGSGFVNFGDLAVLKASFGSPPGPSGLVP